jgi:hypothetical protein
MYPERLSTPDNLSSRQKYFTLTRIPSSASIASNLVFFFNFFFYQDGPDNDFEISFPFYFFFAKFHNTAAILSLYTPHVSLKSLTTFLTSFTVSSSSPRHVTKKRIVFIKQALQKKTVKPGLSSTSRGPTVHKMRRKKKNATCINTFVLMVRVQGQPIRQTKEQISDRLLKPANTKNHQGHKHRWYL